MYSQASAMAAAPQKPETFMLSTEAQQALPHDAQVALQQVDNRKFETTTLLSFDARRSRPPNGVGLTWALSEILPHLRTCRLATRSVHPQIPFAYW